MTLKTDRDSFKTIIVSKQVAPPAQPDLSFIFTFLSGTLGIIIGLFIAYFTDFI